MKRLAYIFILILSTVLYIRCERKNTNHPAISIQNSHNLQEVIDNLEEHGYPRNELSAISQYLTEKRDFNVLISTLKSILSENIDNTDNRLDLININLSQAYVFLEKFDSSHYYISQIKDPGSLPENLILPYNNISALLDIKLNMNYSQALYYLNKNLKLTKEGGDNAINYCPTLCNIATIYYEREDTSGFTFAKEAYNYSLNNSSYYAHCYSAILMAQFLNLKENFNESLTYSTEARNTINLINDDSYIMPILLVQGDSYMGLGNLDSASHYYSEAIRISRKNDQSNEIESLLKLGILENTRHNYNLSIKILTSALQKSYNSGNVEKRHKILEVLADSYDNMGDKGNALKFYRIYNKLSDSISIVQRERDFHNLSSYYTKMDYEAQLYENNIKIHQSRQQMIVTLSLLIIAVMTATWLYSIYRKKNELYKALAQKHMEYSERVQKLKDENIKRDENQDKDRQIFDMIEKYMNEEKPYKNPDMTIEKLSEAINSNRTYVSRIINKIAGMSFTNYINQKRIEEATSLLSNDSDIPLKEIAFQTGFGSLSSFSRVFLREVGCPPSKYREYSISDNDRTYNSSENLM